MKVRTILVGTAVVSSVLGALVAYLILSVPNDLKAGSLLKEARTHIAAGRNAQAHDKLAEIIQRFPRTDAAAAATVALVKLEEQERARIQSELKSLRTAQEAQGKAVSDLQKSVVALRATPPPAATATAPPPAKATVTPKAAAKKTTTKKPTAKKRPTKKTPTKRRKR